MSHMRFFLVAMVAAFIGTSSGGVDSYNMQFVIPNTTTYYVSPSGYDNDGMKIALTSGNVSLTISGVDFTINATNTSSITINATIVSYNTRVSNIKNSNLHYNFSGSYNTTFTLNTWVPAASSGEAVNFTASSQNGNNISYTVGSLTGSADYTIKKGGVAYVSRTVNASGYLSFSNSAWSEHTFTIEQNAAASPSSGTGGGGGSGGSATFLAELTELIKGTKNQPALKIEQGDKVLQIILQNEGANPQEYIINWNIRDVKNAIINTGVESKKLNPNEKYIKQVVTDNLGAGDYVIRVVVQYGIYQSEANRYFTISSIGAVILKSTVEIVSITNLSIMVITMASLAFLHFGYQKYKNRKKKPRQHLWRIQ